MDMQTTTSRPGGRILADALVAQGIDRVFAVPGESYLDVLDGLYARQDHLHLVTCRFEAGAVHMAEAYGKLTGRPAAAMVTRGPGACHAAIGVHVAMQDSTPLLLFVGQIPFGETDRDSFQEVDYRRMFGPLAKWVTQIDDPRRIPELVAHAVDVATTGRPGPVVIALSEEMQHHLADVPDLGPIQVSRPQPDPAALARMAELLAGSRRPLAILGGTCWSAAGRRCMTARCPTSPGTSASAPTRRWWRGRGRPTWSSPSAHGWGRRPPRAMGCSPPPAARRSSMSTLTLPRSAGCSARRWASPRT